VSITDKIAIAITCCTLVVCIAAVYRLKQLRSRRKRLEENAKSELERMFATQDGAHAIDKTIADAENAKVAAYFRLASGILIYAGKKSAVLREGLTETICVLESKSLLGRENSGALSVCFDDIFIEVAAVCFAFLLGSELRGESAPGDKDYAHALRNALGIADGMITQMAQTKRPDHYLTHRVFSYALPQPGATPFESFNTRVLSSLMPGRDPMFDLASTFLTQQTQITFANLNPDLLEKISRDLQVESEQLK